MTKIHKATHEGELEIGDMVLPCAVLEDGTRVLSERGMARALGRSSGGARRYFGEAKMPRYLEPRAISGFIEPELREAIAHPIKFRLKGGKPANGVPASILPKICDVWIRADQKSVLTGSQKAVAEKAYTLMRGFAHVGIIALVDEATGYQEERTKDELQQILSAYIAEELLPWVRRFPSEFYKELFRLHGWAYNPMSVKRPSMVGHLTNELIYDKLPPGVLDELKRQNPKDEKGRRKHKHHQFLTPDIGNPHLEKQLAIVTSFMRASSNKAEFMRLFRRAFPDKYPQQELELETTKPDELARVHLDQK